MIVTNLIGHCVDHAHYPSTVPHVIASAADLLTLVQPQRTHRTGIASWLETRLDRQDTVVKTNSKCAIARKPSDGTKNHSRACSGVALTFETD